jgi:hypothetical protein
MANYLGFKLVKDAKLHNILKLIPTITGLLGMVLGLLSFIISYIYELNSVAFIISLCFISLVIISYISGYIYAYVNFLKMHGTILLQGDNIKIIIEKEQYGFLFFKSVPITNHILPMEDIVKIEILHLGHEKNLKSEFPDKSDGHNNTIFIQTKDSKYDYCFFSDEKYDKIKIANYVIFWKQNYDVEIKWGGQILEEKDVDRLIEYYL